MKPAPVPPSCVARARDDDGAGWVPCRGHTRHPTHSTALDGRPRCSSRPAAACAFALAWLVIRRVPLAAWVL
jgi:hypothetical protein